MHYIFRNSHRQQRAERAAEQCGRAGRNSELALRQIAISYRLNLGELSSLSSPPPTQLSKVKKAHLNSIFDLQSLRFFTGCCHSLFIYIASIYFTQLRSSLIAARGRQRKCAVRRISLQFHYNSVILLINRRVIWNIFILHVALILCLIYRMEYNQITCLIKAHST